MKLIREGMEGRPLIQDTEVVLVHKLGFSGDRKELWILILQLASLLLLTQIFVMMILTPGTGALLIGLAVAVEVMLVAALPGQCGRAFASRPVPVVRLRSPVGARS